MRPWELEENEDKILWLFTPQEYQELPNGIKLEDINGGTAVKGKDYIDMDTRGGHIAYGVREIKTHPLAKLFTKFLLSTKQDY